jgi:hypothetical protein
MPANADSPSSSRALVEIGQPARAPRRRHPIERTPNFLTHLLATRLQLPQARARRRADPDEVIAAYQATIARLRALKDQ